MNDKTTDFGFKQVPLDKKAGLVAEVFHNVANVYDLMNDVASFGLHRIWKRYTLALCQVRAGQRILDVAGGTGDLTAHFSRKVGRQGEVWLADINASMLARGRERLINEGLLSNLYFVQGDAECLPFPDNYFHCITIAFGLRNVTDKDAALRSMCRVLKPGGQLLVLEFSRPILPFLQKMYDLYSFKFLPKLGEWIAKDAASYQYLVESIRQHPDQHTLLRMLEKAGFGGVRYHNLTGGIVAVHRGYKF